MQFKRMIEEMSSILWGLSLAFNIILLLVGLPMCLLICCCCRKHQGVLEKDLRTIVRNHNLLREDVEEQDVDQIPEQPQQRRKVKTVQGRVTPQQKSQNQSHYDNTPLPETLPNVDYVMEE